MAGLDHGETDGQSTFLWFVAMLVLLATISVQIIWKTLVTCFLKPTKTTKRDASVQTIEHYGGEVRLGSVWVTKAGERYHRYECGHISMRDAKRMTPCRDCIYG